MLTSSNFALFIWFVGSSEMIDSSLEVSNFNRWLFLKLNRFIYN